MIISKYENETRDFFINQLAPEQMLKEKAKKLGVTYESIHYSFKINRVSHTLFYKIIQNFDLTQEQKESLKKLVK